MPLEMLSGAPLFRTVASSCVVRRCPFSLRMKIIDDLPFPPTGVTTSPQCVRLRIVTLVSSVLTKIEPLMEHVIHKPTESRRAYEQRRHTIAFAMILALVVAAALAVLLVG